MKRILVVDDEPQITRVLRTALENSGYQVEIANDGAEALKRFEAKVPDLIVTDLSMPGMDGLQVTQAVRRMAETPIIVLSVRGADTVKAAALDEGAHDYLTKPFSMIELLARVRANLRRAPADAAASAFLEAGDFTLDAAAHRVTMLGEELHLSPKEFELMQLLLENAGRVMTRKVLLRTIWGPAGVAQPDYLRILVGQLRKKLDRGGGKLYIESEPWIGYRLEADGLAVKADTTRG